MCLNYNIGCHLAEAYFNSNLVRLKDLRTVKQHLGIEVKKGFHPIRAWRENHLIKEVGIAPHIVAELLGHTQVIQREHYVTALGGKVIENLVNKYKIVQYNPRIIHANYAKKEKP